MGEITHVSYSMFYSHEISTILVYSEATTVFDKSITLSSY